MAISPETVAPCGLYCGVCRIYLATREDDRNYLKRLLKIYTRRIPELAAGRPGELLCDGCLSTRRSLFCRECSIRACVQGKGLQGCHQCDDFPCRFVDEFPMPEGKQVILRAIPCWRSHGTEAFLQAEERRYRCAECGQKLFRGAKSCPHCRSKVYLD